MRGQQWILLAAFVMAGCATMEVAQRDAPHTAITIAHSVDSIQVITPYELEGRVLVRVIYVVDGDTYDIIKDGIIYRVRDLGVDTPEIHHPRITQPEPYSQRAREARRELMEGKEVLIEGEGDRDFDDFGRLLRHARLLLPDGSELSIEEEMVRRGLARAYRRDVPDDYPDINQEHYDRFIALEEKARAEGVGRWHSRKKKVVLQSQ